MAREYFNAYHSILEAMEPLNDAERGRLFTALLVYSSTGAAEKLSGNERFVFPGLRSQIDRDVKKYEDFCQQQSEKGKKGGRPPKAEESQKTQSFSEKPKKAKEKEKEKEKEKDKENILTDSPAGDPPALDGNSRKRFVPPSVEDVRAYCEEKGYSLVNPERFVNYYSSNGWMVGKTKMKDWKSAVAGWQSREKERQKKEPQSASSYSHGADRLAAMIGRGDFDD